jgi:hypothetical protein
MPGLIHIGVLFEAESGIGSKLTMKAMQNSQPQGTSAEEEKER